MEAKITAKRDAGNFPAKGRVREEIAKTPGTSGRTYEKAKQILELRQHAISLNCLPIYLWNLLYFSNGKMEKSRMPPSNLFAPSPIEPVAPARDPITGTFKKAAITYPQAFDLYCKLPDMSLRAFARELNERGIKISYALVGRWSAKYKWQHRRAALKGEGPVGLLTIQERITHLADMSDQCKRETANGLLVQIMESVSNNLGQIEIRSPEDAHAMIDLAQKIVELRDTIEMDPQEGGRSAAHNRGNNTDVPDIGSFRKHVIKGGNIPGRS